MRLVARIASDPGGVIGGHDLRKRFRLGAVSLVTAGAHQRRIKLWRSHRCWIFRVAGKRSMAGLAGNYYVPAQLFLIDDVGVASLAGLVSGKRNRTCRNLGNGISAIVPILPEAARNDGGAKGDECNRSNCHDKSQPNEMFDVLKHARLLARLRSRAPEMPDAFLYVVFRSRTMIFVTGDCDESHPRIARLCQPSSIVQQDAITLIIIDIVWSSGVPSELGTREGIPRRFIGYTGHDFLPESAIRTMFILHRTQTGSTQLYFGIPETELEEVGDRLLDLVEPTFEQPRDHSLTPWSCGLPDSTAFASHY